MRWCVLVIALLLVVSGAGAEEWGAIVPGATTSETVRALYGPPTRTAPVKIDRYDTTQWVYDGARAPTGMQRMTVDFGLLTPSGYRADLVRTFRLEPKPRIFDRRTVMTGWGAPTKIGREGDSDVYYYQEGLLVYFAKDGFNVTTMVFTPPQPDAPPSPPTPVAPAPAPPRQR